jgi:hypothetical protein
MSDPASVTVPYAVLAQPDGVFPVVDIDAGALACRIEMPQPGRVALAWRLPPAARSGPLEVTGAVAATRSTIWIRLEADAPTAITVRRPADIDGDGFVDAADLSVLLGDWGTNEQRSDLNIDGTVDAADHALVLGAWGTHTRNTP